MVTMQANEIHGGEQPGEDTKDMRAMFVQTLLSKRSEAISGRASSGIEV